MGVNLEDGALRRGRLYAAAGADGVFVPGAASPAAVGRIVDELGVPVNVMASPGGLPISELADLGVARVSLGSGVAEAASSCVAQAVQGLRRGELPTATTALGYSELNATCSAASSA